MKTLLKPLSLALFVAATLPTQSAYIRTSPPSDTIPATGSSPSFCKAIGGPASEAGNSLIQTSDGGYAIAGSTKSFGAGWNDVYVVKLDKNGDACCAVSQTSQVGTGGRLGSSPTPSIGSGGTLTAPTPSTSSGGTLTNQCR
jgi:hypothetical protein